MSAALTINAQAPGARQNGRVAGIDGLRALAVVGVLLFHADLAWSAGGFLGVDLFFVVSGFLITRLLLAEHDRSGTISFAGFYARRARRILPALVATVAVSAIAAALLAPDALPQLRADAIATLLFVVNWHYVFQDLSYFEVMGRQPLLQHCWSLAIEEQFYLLWPLVVLFVVRRGSRTGLGVLAVFLAIASAAAMGYQARLAGFPESLDIARAYFGTDTHAMGLAAGAALAVFLRVPATAPARGLRVGPTVLGIAGLAGTLALYGFVDETTAWLYPHGFVAGTLAALCAITACALPGSGTTRLLEWAPLRWLGERSYGIYLWHWPIYMLTRPGVDVDLSADATLVLRIVATLVVADISYRALEAPILGRAGVPGIPSAARLPAPPPAFGWGVASALAAVGAFVLVVGGVPQQSSIVQQESAPGPALVAQPTVAPPRPVAPAAGGFTVVGDSVVLGARGAIERGIDGAVVYAHVGWQLRDVQDMLRRARTAGDLAPNVIVHVGTNGYISEAGMRGVLQSLADRTLVLVVNSRVPRRWMGANNALLARVVGDYPNARLVDWHAAADARIDWFGGDGVHLTPTGARAFVALLAEHGARERGTTAPPVSTVAGTTPKGLGAAFEAPPRAEDPADYAPTLVRYTRPRANDAYWDGLARCETGARWQRAGAFAGGLGIDAAAWRRYGGGVFGATADAATRAQQIEVANRIATEGHALADGRRVPPAGFARWRCVAHLPPPTWRLFVPESLLATRYEPGQRGRAVRELQMLLGLRADGVYSVVTAKVHHGVLRTREAVAGTSDAARSTPTADAGISAASVASLAGARVDAAADATVTASAVTPESVAGAPTTPIPTAGVNAEPPAEATP